ncbi:helix-turn-helix domain-containing protein [Gemmiger sp.]
MTENTLGSCHGFQNILEVENWGSRTDTQYRIQAPIQVTVEYCSGLADEDHYNILMFSPNGCWFRGEQNDEMFRALSARPPHSHDYFELMLVLQGEMIQQIEGQEYLYRAGTCCLINRSIMHTERFIGEAKLCFIGLSTEFVQELANENGVHYFAEERRWRDNPILQFMLANLGSEVMKEYQDLFPTHSNRTGTQRLHDLTDRLTNVMMQPGPASGYYMKGALCELFSYLQDEFYATPVRLATDADSLLFLRIRRLLEDTDGRLSRSELAKLLHYNGSYLNSVVRRRTGLCLFDYGMTFCFRKAEMLLRDTDLSVSEIALQLKFTNRTHFYTLFHKKYGMTPQAWRAAQRGKADESIVL